MSTLVSNLRMSIIGFKMINFVSISDVTSHFLVNTHKSEYGNYQRLTLQESPGSVPPGRVPRYKDVVLLGDLVDIARPGEEIEVT